MLMPVSLLEKSLLYFHEHYDLYPLWVCPMAVYEYPNGNGFLKPYEKPDGTMDEMFVDIGAYGTPKKAGFNGNTALQALEQFVIAHKGYQALYAKTLLSREDFRKMFSHQSYDRVRQSLTNCTKAFSEVYDNVRGKARISPSEYRAMK